MTVDLYLWIKQNLFVFKGLRPEFCSPTTSLTVRGVPVTLQELSNFLGAHEFISVDDFQILTAPSAALVVALVA